MKFLRPTAIACNRSIASRMRCQVAGACQSRASRSFQETWSSDAVAPNTGAVRYAWAKPGGFAVNLKKLISASLFTRQSRYM
jgi:hypothetical protein